MLCVICHMEGIVFEYRYASLCVTCRIIEKHSRNALHLPFAYGNIDVFTPFIYISAMLGGNRNMFIIY